MKLWKGRFSKAATSSADEFNASIEFDQRLYKEDITGSIAHAKMLAKQGIIPQEDADLIVKTRFDTERLIEKHQAVPGIVIACVAYAEHVAPGPVRRRNGWGADAGLSYRPTL